jgi:hypothetical protein
MMGEFEGSGTPSECGHVVVNVTHHDFAEKFVVGRKVFGGKVNFFVRKGESAVSMWEGSSTPHYHVSPCRTMWDRLFHKTFEQECEHAHFLVQEWCDWANAGVEKSKKLDEKLKKKFGEG